MANQTARRGLGSMRGLHRSEKLWACPSRRRACLRCSGRVFRYNGPARVPFRFPLQPLTRSGIEVENVWQDDGPLCDLIFWCVLFVRRSRVATNQTRSARMFFAKSKIPGLKPGVIIIRPLRGEGEVVLGMFPSILRWSIFDNSGVDGYILRYGFGFISGLSR